MTGIRRDDLALPGRGRSRVGSGAEAVPDLRCSGVAASCGGRCRFAAHPTIAAVGGISGHGATGLAVLAVVLLVVVALSARDDRRRRRRRRLTHDRRGRVIVVGVVLLGLVAGATATGGAIAHLVVAALVAIGHALAGMLP